MKTSDAVSCQSIPLITHGTEILPTFDVTQGGMQCYASVHVLPYGPPYAKYAGMSCFQHCMDAMYAAMPDGMHRHTKHIALSRAMRANRKTNIHINSRSYEKEEKPI
ncbi:hypothetical protein [Bacteroides gallinaceum]|uniref:hypothetical protein n=1 Tax=Bacteroides gallinaceum TaxID=1462571 RepID=UPI0025AAF967|nr:hypothetical protein [Bacteroides gallinaceum]MDN0066709.1 hypothetical protein [Bacteroides gallinaceum]